jgi:alginate O-acetyltransferase complex protein AlgI
LLFNSYPFVFGFLPLVLLGFALLARWRARTASIVFLILASLFFYGRWNWKYLFLILFSIGFNYSWGLFLQRLKQERNHLGPSTQRRILALGVAVNLALLGYFKYRNFFLDTVNAALGTHLPAPPLELPLAISFFTFEQIIYLVGAYHGEVGDHDFLSYGLFITFFPHLIAGPIVRYKDIIPQLIRGSTFLVSKENLVAGLLVFAIGLFKKVIIADSFRGWVAAIFDNSHGVALGDAWGGALAFAMQIYFDFSGYSDMAIGLALMLNVRFPENFDSPYQARSIIDFWRRWHMTLSTFLRDFLYIPLGGNRKGTARTYVNLLVTMLLGGLWHGANWTFVVWGGLHGLFLAINHLWRQTRGQLPAALSWPITFLAVLVAWVFFRAQSFQRASQILRGMIGLSGMPWNTAGAVIGLAEWKLLLVALALVLWAPNRQTIMGWRWSSDYVYAAAFAMMAGFSILRLANPPSFIYFQF